MILLLYEWMFCLHENLCTNCVSGACEGKKRTSESLELELRGLRPFDLACTWLPFRWSLVSVYLLQCSLILLLRLSITLDYIFTLKSNAWQYQLLENIRATAIVFLWLLELENGISIWKTIWQFLTRSNSYYHKIQQLYSQIFV